MQRLLIIGCGDVAQRALPWLKRRFRVYALARGPASAEKLARLGVTPVVGDLDRPATLLRLAGVAEHVLHCAPPPNSGTGDPRTARLLAALSMRASVPRHLVYVSTSGVYGDSGGDCVSETRPLRPSSARALRRMAAERLLRAYGVRNGTRVVLLRAPGIYAAERLPVERVRAATPAILHEQDSYSNHIHADDLALACCLALFRGLPGRACNVCDDASWRMGEWFDRVADSYGLSRPPRLPRAEVAQQVSPMLWSFMNESRRLLNQRMKHELGLQLAYPTPQTLLDRLNER